MRIALTTGGGDAPGLNAVIRAAVLSAINRGWSAYGIQSGYAGLLGDREVVRLGRNEVRGITHVGGTILGTTNRGDPFRWPVEVSPGVWEERDRSDELLRAFDAHGFDGLIAIGGDGSLRIAHDLHRKGLNVVGVPKTIDNDVGGTVATFGYDTAVTVATEALDRLHSTAEAHERVLVVEVMGRNAGWIALNAGIAGSADVILIPEIPFKLELVAQKILERETRGRRFSLVVVAEGAYPAGSGEHFVEDIASPGGVRRLGGIARHVADLIEAATGKETREVVLGHLQRGGSPTNFDRRIALRFGAAAVRAIASGAFGSMVAYQPPDVVTVPLEEALRQPKRVDPEGDTIQTARDLGICLGD